MRIQAPLPSRRIWRQTPSPFAQLPPIRRRMRNLTPKVRRPAAACRTRLGRRRRQNEGLGFENRLKVAVDVDEVLGQFLVALNAFCQERYGMLHNVEDYHVYHFATIWGCSQEMSTEIVHEFFQSPDFHQLPLVPGAFEALCEMQEWCDLHVVTSRQHVIREITVKWLSTHYPGIFTSVQFGNHFARDGTSKKKSELCKSIDADVLIDDNPDYAVDCASSGIHVLLYNWQNGYPWSQMLKTDERISKVSCWSDVPRMLKEIFLWSNDREPALI